MILEISKYLLSGYVGVRDGWKWEKEEKEKG